MIALPNPETKNQTYCFRGKIFMSDEKTIKQLNYALALNHRAERYERVFKEKPFKRYKEFPKETY